MYRKLSALATIGVIFHLAILQSSILLAHDGDGDDHKSPPPSQQLADLSIPPTASNATRNPAQQPPAQQDPTSDPMGASAYVNATNNGAQETNRQLQEMEKTGSQQYDKKNGPGSYEKKRRGLLRQLANFLTLGLFAKRRAGVLSGK